MICTVHQMLIVYQTKENETGGTCGTCGDEEGCIESVGRET